MQARDVTRCGLRTASTLLLAGLFLAMATTAQALIIYDEALQGDLTDNGGDGSVPTPIGTFGPGDNDVLGTMGDDGSNDDDSDLFTFGVPSGLQITSIALAYEVLSGDAGNGSYFAIQTGTSIGTTMSTVGDNSSNALAGESGDLLALWEAGPAFGGTGLVGPLPAGDYSIFVGEITGEIAYGMRFGVEAVPEPKPTLLLATGLLLWLRRRT